LQRGIEGDSNRRFSASLVSETSFRFPRVSEPSWPAFLTQVFLCVSAVKRFLLPLFSALLFAQPAMSAETGACTPPKFEPPVFSGKETPEEKGLAIARAVRNRDAGYVSQFLAKGVAVTTNVKGEERTLKFTARLFEKGSDGAQKTLFLFDEPVDVKGFGAMSYIFPFAPEEQWYFLPELQRVKRVSGDSRTSSFLGTTFTNEDFVLAFPVVERYAYKYIGEEPCGELACHVIDRFPLYEYSGYTRYRVWIDKRDFQFRKVDFYDRKNALIKTLLFNDYKLYLNHWWRWDNINLTDLQTGKNTHVSYEWHVCAGMTEEDFSINALKRVR
jgi:hypothetical protein